MRNDNSHFTFYNVNPKGRVRTFDCVVRAISFATGRSWEFVMTELTKYGISLGMTFNDVGIYGRWLEKSGWKKYKQPRKPDNRKYTVKEFATKWPLNTYIIKVAGHLTVVKDGIIYDTWNCGRKAVGNFWVYENN